MSREEVREIIAQLHGLQLQQTALLSRLERLNEGATEEQTTHAVSPGPSPPKSINRAFAIGDQVRITNPRRLQATRGKIIKIGARVTVQAPDGSKIVRSAKNLIHDKHE